MEKSFRKNISSHLSETQVCRANFTVSFLSFCRETGAALKWFKNNKNKIREDDDKFGDEKVAEKMELAVGASEFKTIVIDQSHTISKSIAVERASDFKILFPIILHFKIYF